MFRVLMQIFFANEWNIGGKCTVQYLWEGLASVMQYEVSPIAHENYVWLYELDQDDCQFLEQLTVRSSMYYYNGF